MATLTAVDKSTAKTGMDVIPMKRKYPYYWGCQSCGGSPINGWYETAEMAAEHKPTECSNIYHGSKDGRLPDGRGGWRDVPVAECFHIAKHGEGYI